MKASKQSPVLEVNDLRTYFSLDEGTLKAVDGVSFDVHEGETLGIVGESGCGKSMTALSMLRLTPQPASRIVGGQVILDGVDLLQLSEDDMRKVRGREISMILQDPQTSLNPVFTIGNQLLETISLHGGKKATKASLKERAITMLRRMGVPAPERRMEAYPHQMSGGMKQRVVGGIAIESKPRVMIADEPTTALDVTIQAQYLRLLKTIQAAFTREPDLINLMRDADFGQQLADAEPAWRSVVALAKESGVPCPAISASLDYYDAYRSARLPANLIQAQRDYFGAHTYRRIDRDGVFHTRWEEGAKTGSATSDPVD